jgi:hypothetical protein
MLGYDRYLRSALVSLTLCSVAHASFAAKATDAAALQQAVQTAIATTTDKAAQMSATDAQAAFRTAIQAVIARSGARPRVVRAALSKVSCSDACAVALSGIETQVIQLAEFETRNENVAAISAAPLSNASTPSFTATSFSATPLPATGDSGGGSSYTAQ